MLTVTLIDNEIQIGERFRLSFRRTLRIPDDGRAYPLPPTLGRFPVFRTIDLSGSLPAHWRSENDFILPIRQREALWIALNGAFWKPNAVKVSVGTVNAISGEVDDENLSEKPQNYVVCPPQFWLDGILSGEGRIRQFVAMPIGSGYTVEGQLTGKEVSAAMEIEVFEPNPGSFQDEPPFLNESAPAPMMVAPREQGIAVGGQIRQKVYCDPHGMKSWDIHQRTSIRVHLVNSGDYVALTGCPAPPTPVSAAIYTERGFPWFDLYDEIVPHVDPTDTLARILSVRAKDEVAGKPAGEEERTADIHLRQIRGIELRERDREMLRKPGKPE